jgi:hypothetical protein
VRRRPGLGRGGIAVAGRRKQLQEGADAVPVLGRLPERAVEMDRVAGAPSGPGAGQVPGGLQVGDDGLGGPVGQVGRRGDVPDPDLGVAGDLHRYVPVPVSSVQLLSAWSRKSMPLTLLSRETNLMLPRRCGQVRACGVLSGVQIREMSHWVQTPPG